VRAGAILLAIPEVEPRLFEPAWSGAAEVLAALSRPELALIEAVSEAQLRSDTEQAQSRLKPGGVLAWRGYAESPEANRYLNALRHKLPLVRLAGTDLVVSRVPGGVRM
jgi:hypothetical protein